MYRCIRLIEHIYALCIFENGMPGTKNLHVLYLRTRILRVGIDMPILSVLSGYVCLETENRFLVYQRTDSIRITLGC